LMFGVSASGKLTQKGETFVPQHIQKTNARRVETFHGHVLDQAIEFKARMGCAGLAFGKTHCLQQRFLIVRRNFLKSTLELLTAQAIEQPEALHPLEL